MDRRRLKEIQEMVKDGTLRSVLGRSVETMDYAEEITMLMAYALRKSNEEQ